MDYAQTGNELKVHHPKLPHQQPTQSHEEWAKGGPRKHAEWNMSC